MIKAARRIIALDISAIAGIYSSDAPHENSSVFDSCQKGEAALAETIIPAPGRIPERPATAITAKNAYRCTSPDERAISATPVPMALADTNAATYLTCIQA